MEVYHFLDHNSYHLHPDLVHQVDKIIDTLYIHVSQQRHKSKKVIALLRSWVYIFEEKYKEREKSAHSRKDAP